MITHPYLSILQYNTQKSKNGVLAPLLADRNTRNIDILAIQEPWRNPHILSSYNPSSSPFYLSYKPHEHTRVSFYINKRLNLTNWSVTHPSPDIAVLIIQLTHPQRQPRTVKVYNIYNPPPYSHATESTDASSSIPLLQLLLSQDPPTLDTILIGDFNLHHPL